MVTFHADSRYEANLDLLSQTMPQMVENIRQFPLTNVQLMPTTGGEIYGHCWSVELQQWIPLCNSEDPLAEAERDCESMYSPHIKVYSLLGMGLGYFVAALAKRLRPYQRLVVFDVDPNMYKASLYAVDLTPVLREGKRIDFIIGNDALQQVEAWWLGLEATEKLHIAGPMRAGYTGGCHREMYDAVLAKCVDMIRIHAVGLSTWRTFGSAIGDNDLQNMPEYFLHPGYEHLEGLWANKPAVCIAAGPSLQKNLRLLLNPAFRAKVLVIAVGTVYAMLQRLGIQPDIVTTIDFQRLNWTDQFQYVPLDDAPALVYLHSTYPQTIRRWPGPKFVAENASDTVNWFKAYSEGKKGAGQVQTVAHLNLLVAATLGANPILLLGQDLSMPPDQHHAAGARAQDQAPNETAPEAFVTETDCYGQPVHTRHSFLSMRSVFERIVQEHPTATFVNCTEGGLPLTGLQNIPLRTVLEALPDLDTAASQPPGTTLLQIRQRLATVAATYVPQVKPEFYEALETLCADVEAIADAATTIQTLAKTHGLEDAVAQTGILAQEALIQEKRSAFGLFAIRHFGILELISEIPPADEEVPDESAKAIYNCRRLSRVATMIEEELPQVRYLLHGTQRRIQILRHGCCLQAPLTRDDVVTLCRALARQHYGVVATALDTLLRSTHGEEDPLLWGILRRLRGRVAYHQQQYIVATACGLSEAHTARATRHRLHDTWTTMQALAAYFPQETAAPVEEPPALGTSEDDQATSAAVALLP